MFVEVDTPPSSLPSHTHTFTHSQLLVGYRGPVEILLFLTTDFSPSDDIAEWPRLRSPEILTQVTLPWCYYGDRCTKDGVTKVTLPCDVHMYSPLGVVMNSRQECAESGGNTSLSAPHISPSPLLTANLNLSLPLPTKPQNKPEREEENQVQTDARISNHSNMLLGF